MEDRMVLDARLALGAHSGGAARFLEDHSWVALQVDCWGRRFLEADMVMVTVRDMDMDLALGMDQVTVIRQGMDMAPVMVAGAVVK